MAVEYLVVGALTCDVLGATEWRPGGSGLYAAQAVARWGGAAAILTSLALQYNVPDLESTIRLLRLPSAQTATFENRYSGNQRTQYLRSIPEPIAWPAIPPAWRAAEIVHLAPLTNELRLPPRAVFPGALIGLTPQGWMRSWAPDGLIHPLRWEPTQADLAQLDVVVVSDEDGASETAVERWSTWGTITAMTRAERGATLWRAGQRLDVPAYPAAVVDPTGAGDVWCAALLWQLRAGAALETAARWACAAAACSIEGAGASAIPDRAAVLARLALPPLEFPAS